MSKVKKRILPTNVSDDQWELIRKFLPLPKFGGRPRTANVSYIINALIYMVRTGCQWRMLPLDFPPWQTVNHYFNQWRKDGTLRKIHRFLYRCTRVAEGRSKNPTAICIDSQSVKTGKAGGDRGYDGGKKVKGRKRHLVVDTLGLMVDVAVTPANVHDKVGAKKVLTKVSRWIKPNPSKLYADGGYDGKPFANWVNKTLGATVEISVNLAQIMKKFIPAKKRWVVERSFAWFGDYRRLDKDHERLKSSSLAMMRLAVSSVFLKRLDALEIASYFRSVP